MVNIEGLKKADVLVALYNNSKPLGMGILQFRNEDMVTEEAEELLKQMTYFDYLKGRVMKLDLSSDVEFSERLYDRDNGEGKAQSIINALRKFKGENI